MLYRQIGYFFWGLSLSQNNKVGVVVGG